MLTIYVVTLPLNIFPWDCLKILFEMCPQVNKRAGLSPGKAAKAMASRLDLKRKRKGEVAATREGKRRRLFVKGRR